MANSSFNPQVQNAFVDDKIVAALERVSQAFRVMLWEQSKTHQLSPIQIQVLIFLLHHTEDVCKVSYLAKEFNVTKATISDTIKTLSNKSLIQRVHAPQDSRSYIIQLTDKGKSVADSTSQFSQAFNAPLQGLSAAQKHALLESLFTIIKQLNNAGIVSVQRMCFSCIHYKTGHQGEQHYCTLLNQPLTSFDLRIDCPEHQPNK